MPPPGAFGPQTPLCSIRRALCFVPLPIARERDGDAAGRFAAPLFGGLGSWWLWKSRGSGEGGLVALRRYTHDLFDGSSLLKRSIGTGKTVVELFSVAISLRVCR